jgi:hypothetical protein
VLLSRPIIRTHEDRQLAKRPRLVAVPYTLAPGEHPFTETRDGKTTKGRAIAPEREIIYLSEDGRLLRSEPNRPSHKVVNIPPATLAAVTQDGTLPACVEVPPDSIILSVDEFERGQPIQAKAKQGDGPDDHVLETYLTQKCITGYREKEAREKWRIFRAEVGKRLNNCTRDDGRKIVDAAQGPARCSTL